MPKGRVSKDERKATMVYLRPAAWRAIKLLAMDRNASMTAEIEEAVERYLAEARQEQEERQKDQARPLGEN
jgi:uncharacterized protein with von Willebrand factor type A (vWA) domain